MMKKLIIILVVVMLLASAVGGYAYAQTTHQPMVGQKLVGWGALGVDPGTDRAFYTRFVITNPDCVSQITNIEIRIIKDDGTEYPGVLIRPSQSSPSTTLGPHESGVVDLASCVSPGVTDPREWDRAPYTVEVSWTGTKGGLPLTGWSWLATATFDVDPGTGNITFIEDVATSAVSQMVNMTQVLAKSK